jgi:hypothetical protein
MVSVVMRADSRFFIAFIPLVVPALVATVHNCFTASDLKSRIRSQRIDSWQHTDAWILHVLHFSRRLSWVCGVTIFIMLPLRWVFLWNDVPVVMYPEHDPSQAQVLDAGIHVVPLFGYATVQYRNFSFRRVVKGYPPLVISIQRSDNLLLLHELYGSQESLEAAVQQKVDSAFAKLDSAHVALTFSPNNDVRYYRYLADANALGEELVATTVRGCREITVRNLAVW